MTLDVYSHVIPSMQEHAAAAMQRVLTHAGASSSKVLAC